MSLLKTLAGLGSRVNSALFGVTVDSTAVAKVVDGAKLRSGLTLLDGSLLQVGN